MCIALLETALLIAAVSQPGTGRVDYDPGLRLSGVLADSIVSGTAGRYGVMGLDLENRTSFVISEGSFFECDSFSLLPVACAVCYRALPMGSMLDFAPDSLVSAAWSGDPRASALLAESIGRERIRIWLESCSILATTLTDSTSSGLPYTTTPWDCMMMLAWMERMLPESGIGTLGAPTVPGDLLDFQQPGSLGILSQEEDGSFRGVFATRTTQGRSLGLTLLVDSVESAEQALDRFGVLLSTLLSGGRVLPD